MQENKKLRIIHLDVIDRMEQLFKIDLINKREEWITHLNWIKKTIEPVSSKDPSSAVQWKKHLDW
jgi:hypothetical protein